jgi:hypothetical protein
LDDDNDFDFAATLPFECRFDSDAVDVIGGLLNFVKIHLLPLAAAGGLLKHERDMTAPILVEKEAEKSEWSQAIKWANHNELPFFRLLMLVISRYLAIPSHSGPTSDWYVVGVTTCLFVCLFVW